VTRAAQQGDRAGGNCSEKHHGKRAAADDHPHGNRVARSPPQRRREYNRADSRRERRCGTMRRAKPASGGSPFVTLRMPPQGRWRFHKALAVPVASWRQLLRQQLREVLPGRPETLKSQKA